MPRNMRKNAARSSSVMMKMGRRRKAGGPWPRWGRGGGGGGGDECDGAVAEDEDGEDEEVVEGVEKSREWCAVDFAAVEDALVLFEFFFWPVFFGDLGENVHLLFLGVDDVLDDVAEAFNFFEIFFDRVDLDVECFAVDGARHGDVAAEFLASGEFCFVDFAQEEEEVDVVDEFGVVFDDFFYGVGAWFLGFWGLVGVFLFAWGVG